MSKKLEHVHFSSIVNLNVGGHCFRTTVQTLTNVPNTELAAIGSGKIKPCEDGVFFIDRDGTHFRFILNYLRDGKLTLPVGATFLKELWEEAKYYEIQGIMDRIDELTASAKTFEESVLLTNENHQSVLKGWLPSQEGKWRLLYRASRDGFAATAFHSKCDNKGPTVTVVKSGNNIFGGFTEVSWSDQREYKRCREAFLFSMVNPHGLGPTRMPLKTENQLQGYGIYCYAGYGPTFGGGNDLQIYDEANTQTSSSNPGHTYELPPGQQGTFFTSSDDSYTVTDYEVFGLRT